MQMGVYDTPLLLYELYVRGHKARGLAHPGVLTGQARYGVTTRLSMHDLQYGTV